MNKREALEQLEALLTPPEHWTQGFDARDPEGIPVGSLDENATCWCLLGGIEKIAPSASDNRLRVDVQNALSASIQVEAKDRFDAENLTDIPEFNDDPRTTHEHILAVVRRAKEDAATDA